MPIYTDTDCDISIIKEKNVLIIGLGNQGLAQARNLKDSGVINVATGLREGSGKADLAKENGLQVFSIADGVKWADLVMVLAPDEVHGQIYDDYIHDNIRPNAAIGFSHGFSVRFGLVKPRADIDVVLMAPKGPGLTLRDLYTRGLGMPCLVGVEQDASGQAFNLSLSYAGAIGAGKAGILKSSFAEECETDLFSEQTVLCGGMPALIKTAYETLVEAGYQPEVAYIECLHEVKQIADLLWEGGLDHMNVSISNTAEFGGFEVGERIVSPEVKAVMKTVLKEIQSGAFAEKFMADTKDGQRFLLKKRNADKVHPIEDSGATVRGMMPWIKS
jgi:ketol-acid reductoisomerase